jgi:hypothetical protein
VFCESVSEPWPFLRGPSSLARFKRWCAYAPTSTVCPRSRPIAVSAYRRQLLPTAERWNRRVSRAPLPSSGITVVVGGHAHHPLGGHYSPVIALSGSCASPVCFSSTLAITSLEESLQVCHQPPAASGTFPTLSLRIFPQMPGPLLRTAQGVRIPVSSSLPSAFPKV